MDDRRKIDSTELEQDLSVSNISVNGVNLTTRLQQAFTALGIPFGATHMGAITPGSLPQNSTVKALITAIAETVIATGANIIDLQNAFAVFINDGYVGTEPDADQKTWSTAKIATVLSGMIDDASSGSSVKTHSQSWLESEIATKTQEIIDYANQEIAARL